MSHDVDPELAAVRWPQLAPVAANKATNAWHLTSRRELAERTLCGRHRLTDCGPVPPGADAPLCGTCGRMARRFARIERRAA